MIDRGMIVLSRLDVLRARLLKFSFFLPGAEEVFRTRALRLFAQFVGAFTVATLFALYLPIAPLIAGPLIAGPMHLLFSARVVRVRWWIPLALIGAATVWLTDMPLVFAILIAFAAMASQAGSRQRGFALLVAGGLFAWLTSSSIFVAAAIAGLAHNFVAFAFWYRACRTRGERLTCLGSYALLTAMTLAILLGAFDLSAVGLPEDLAQGFSILGDPARVLSAFALGQSIHYFVWLKAIPDQTLLSPIPPGFRARYLAFEQKAGRPVLAFVALSTAGLIAWSLIHLDEARLAYAAGAAVHGWLELAALGLP